MDIIDDDDRQPAPIITSEPPEPRFYPWSEYVQLLKLMDSRNTANICSLGIFYKTPFDKVAAPIRDAALLQQKLLQDAIYNLTRGN